MKSERGEVGEQSGERTGKGCRIAGAGMGMHETISPKRNKCGIWIPPRVIHFRKGQHSIVDSMPLS